MLLPFFGDRLKLADGICTPCHKILNVQNAIRGLNPIKPLENQQLWPVGHYHSLFFKAWWDGKSRLKLCFSSFIIIRGFPF